MPETFGKRKRETVKARKANARDERRIARAQRREARAVGVDEHSWLGEANPSGIENVPPPTPDEPDDDGKD